MYKSTRDKWQVKMDLDEKSDNKDSLLNFFEAPGILKGSKYASKM